MFVFLMSANCTIKEAGSSHALYRGFIVQNSEVGASAIKLWKFLFRDICGNYIIWGSSDVMELSARHVGAVHEKWSSWQFQLKRYLEASASEDEQRIEYCKQRVISDTKEGVLDKLFSIRNLNLSRKTLESGYDAVLPAEDGDANTVWGMVQGLTRHSQTMQYADARNAVDRSAGKLLEITF
jgi:hypothetical protein